MTDLMLLDWHAEIAADALDGIAYQSSAAARFLRRGDDLAAIESYKRIVQLQREFVSHELKLLQASIDPLTQEAATEWRADRDGTPKTRAVA